MICDCILILFVLSVYASSNCSSYSFQCKTCLTYSDCSYCASNLQCFSKESLPACPSVVADTTRCGVDNCYGSGVANQCMFATDNFAVKSGSACAAVNSQAPPVIPVTPSACDSAKLEPNCAALIRAFGCTYSCQACNQTTAAALQPVCASTCSAMIAANCANASVACTGLDDPFLFVCQQPGDASACVSDIITSVSLPSLEQCVSAPPPSVCVYDVGFGINDAFIETCASANDPNALLSMVNTTCAAALQGDASCYTAFASIACSESCQACSGTTKLQICEYAHRASTEMCEMSACAQNFVLFDVAVTMSTSDFVCLRSE
jgi:hypothetical protein